MFSRLLALAIAGVAIAACAPPPRDVVFRAPLHYTPTDQRVMLDIVGRQPGDMVQPAN